jgi:hypothetical protein
MGFVSEQKSIGKDQISSCERRDFVDCVPRRLRRGRVKQDKTWLAGMVRWIRNACEVDLELHGINHNDLGWLGENALWAIAGP